MGSDQNIIRKRFCLTKHHNDLLDEIADKRYASRSEALRAAIQHLSQYLSESENADIESLRDDIKQISEEIDTIQEKIDESNSRVVVADQSSAYKNKGESETKSETENEIVKELVKSGSLSADEIAERIGKDIIAVISATQSLQQDGIINSADTNTDKFEANL